nr:unnamed protein product [Digitaria exilis]
MFEGVVSQVLAGLLGRYVKGIQKEQLKIGFWNEEILLENVELILEAFDYLQLPFALKNGRIGKLSIRIPWKKLGWDPIIIVIEDVYVCACPREDSEWSSDSLDKRELAGKLAKLNAIELAKFSRRVTDNQTGQSFLSYISAKILDSIQVSMRNFHIVYMDTHNDQGNFVFGLEFSSLSIQTDTQKQSFTMSLMAMSRQDEVNKIIEISDVGIYCHQLEKQQDLCNFDALGNGHSRDDYLVNPFSVTVSVLANKAAKLDGAPQYDLTVELTALALSVDEIQLQQILNLCDYFTICALRTKYGRYRPPQNSLSKRSKGWQRMWWQYAQNSVLADVRRRLKKTSWRYLKQRLNYRLGYVKLYQMKLELLQKGQIVSKDILQQLENMDKECDIDDILNYRTIAEQQLQESLVKSTKDTSSPGSPRTDELSTGASRGWLNWLSLGMLGAGGTADSSSFAGVISEDIIKVILYSPSFVMRFGMKLVDAMFAGLGMECKIWDNSATILAWLDSLQVINPLNDRKILLAEKCSTGDGLGVPGISIQVDFPKSNQGSEASTRVAVQEFSVIYEPEFFINVLHIYDLFSSFQFQHDRVLSSLNRFDNLGARLVSKLKYLSANRKKLIWDLRVHNFAIRLPSQNRERKELTMVVEAGDVFIQSKDIVDDVSRTLLAHISKSLSSYFSDDLLGIQLYELYNHFEVGLTGFQVKVLLPDGHNASKLIKLDASIAIRLCIFQDEPVLKQLEVGFTVPFIDIYLSQTMYSAIVNVPRVKEAKLVRNSTFDNAKTHGPNKLALNMSVSLKLAKLGLQIDLGNCEESLSIIVGIEGVDIRYAICDLPDLSLTMTTVNITSNNWKDESDSHVPCKEISCSEQSTLPTSIMSKISQCDLVAEDLYFVNGLEMVIGVVDQLISIGKESKMYNGNALQFLEHRSFYEGNPDPNECVNITISIKDLSILLGHLKYNDLARERIATVNLEFDVSAVIISEKPERLNFEIVSLALQSTGGYTLISIVSDGSLAPVFIKFTKHHAGQDEILLSVPLFEWSSHGPVIETLLKNLTVQFNQRKDQTEVSAFVDLLVNYNNIDKVMWEPFIEPSRFQLNMLRKCADCALDISPSTEVCLNSSKQLNLNISEPFIEAMIRLSQMITDSLDPSNGDDLREDPGILRLSPDDVRTRRYAPYILSNDTSLPFRFKVYRGAVNSDDIDSFSVIDENSVPAGCAVPIYVEETLDEFFFQHREARSSEHLIEKRMSAVSHYMISIEFDGTSGPSKPMSMDLVGIYFFEVNFSSSKKPILGEESLGAFSSNRKGNNGLIVPVVLDVSLQNYSKRIRVYSTVILYNATSMPLELRFDIPFGVSSKVQNF